MPSFSNIQTMTLMLEKLGVIHSNRDFRVNFDKGPNGSSFSDSWTDYRQCPMTPPLTSPRCPHAMFMLHRELLPCLMHFSSAHSLFEPLFSSLVVQSLEQKTTTRTGQQRPISVLALIRYIILAKNTPLLFRDV